MTFILKSGTTGSTAEVDLNNRLQTFATSETSSTFAAVNGNAFNINTESINLTSANASSLLYLLNTDTLDWSVNRVFYNAEVSTGGSGKWLAEVLANPTTGTLVSAGTATTPHNLNFGSATALNATTLKGVEGSTLTNGTVRVSTIVPASGTRVLISFDSIILTPGSSIGVRLTPPVGNTDMDVQVGINLHRIA